MNTTLRNQRERLLIIVAAVSVLLLGLNTFVLNPLVRTWKARAVRMGELRASLQKSAVLLDREGMIRERWTQMKSQALPGNVSVAENEVLKAVDRWAQESKISFTSLKPQWKRNADDYMALECRADAFGSMQAVTRFLYNMERDPLALRVEDVEITARDTTGQQLSLAVKVSGLLLDGQQ